MNNYHINQQQPQQKQPLKQQHSDQENQQSNHSQLFQHQSTQKQEKPHLHNKNNHIHIQTINLNSNDDDKNNNQSDNDNDDLSQTIDQEVAGFHVIGQDSTNQVLQVNLYPKQRVFVRGKILYANFDYKNKDQVIGYQSFTQFIKQYIASGFQPMRKIHNIRPNICYFAVSKSGGKLLTIDNDIYSDDIYVNPARVILTNVNHSNSIIKRHSNLVKYQNRLKCNQNNKIQKTLIVLQSVNNNVIIEKYLGAKEKLYVQQKLILALSGTIQAKPSIGGLFTAKLEGPGWVFIENDSNSFKRQKKFVIVIFFMLLFAYLAHLLERIN